MTDEIRIKRLERLALQHASQVVLYELSDPRVTLVTLTRVKLTRDLSYLTIFWSCMGSDADRTKSKHALNSAASVVQGKLASAFNTRRTPRVRFKYDESIAGAIGVGQILDELREERETNEPSDPDPDTAPESDAD